MYGLLIYKKNTAIAKTSPTLPYRILRNNVRKAFFCIIKRSIWAETGWRHE